MSSDQQVLRTLNVAINDAENTGNRDFLASIMAPELAFSRASSAVDDASCGADTCGPFGAFKSTIVQLMSYRSLSIGPFPSLLNGIKPWRATMTRITDR